MPSCFYTTAGSRWTRPPVPGQMGLLPQTVKRDREQESRIASALLGGAVQELSWGAEAFRYYNEKGYLQFHRDGA